MVQDKVLLQKFVREKGVEYFLEGASEEDKKRFEGSLFRDGYPNLSFIQHLVA